MKRSLLLLIVLLIWGCSRRPPEPATTSKAPAVPKTGTISGIVRVLKPDRAPIYVSVGKSFDHLALGRVAKLKMIHQAGPFRLDDVEPGTYRVGAFVDLNGNTVPDISLEPYLVLESEFSVSAGENTDGVPLEGFFNQRDRAFRSGEFVERYKELLGSAKTVVEEAYRKLKAGDNTLLAEVIPTLRAMVFEAEKKWAVTGNRADWEHIERLLEPVTGIAAAAMTGENNLGSLRGCFLRAYLSDLDGSVQRYAVYVPEGYDGSRPFPLVLGLHGGGGDHWDGLRMVAGGAAFLVGVEEANAHFFPRKLPADFIMACPNGHGYQGHGYRAQGEYDVMKVLKEMHSHYNIDSSRVYLTGASKGGTGTWEIGLKYPEMFAAIAPVCGATRAARELVDNAACPRVFAFHGTKDLFIPVSESRTMVDLLEKIGVSVEYFEYENLGHDAAWAVYENGAVFDLFRSAN